jgi:hypothetical protein
MSTKKSLQNYSSPKLIRILRWIARIWSLLALADGLILAFGGGDNQVLKDWPLLALWGVAIISLLVAWKFELIGGITAIAFVILHDLVYLLVKGTWLQGFMILWALIIPPAVIFIISWELERKAKQKYAAEMKKSMSYYAVRSK